MNEHCILFSLHNIILYYKALTGQKWKFLTISAHYAQRYVWLFSCSLYSVSLRGMKSEVTIIPKRFCLYFL